MARVQPGWGADAQPDRVTLESPPQGILGHGRKNHRGHVDKVVGCALRCPGVSLLERQPEVGLAGVWWWSTPGETMSPGAIELLEPLVGCLRA